MSAGATSWTSPARVVVSVRENDQYLNDEEDREDRTTGMW